MIVIASEKPEYIPFLQVLHIVTKEIQSILDSDLTDKEKVNMIQAWNKINHTESKPLKGKSKFGEILDTLTKEDL